MPPHEVLTRANKKKKKILNASEEFLVYTKGVVTTFQVLKGESDQADEMYDQNMCAKKNNLEEREEEKKNQGRLLNQWVTLP